MKYLYAFLGVVISFLLSLAAQKICLSMTGRFYSLEHGSGTFSYVYGNIIMFTPLFGAVICWKYWSTKRKALLWFFPIYFLVMYLFYWYSGVYAGYPFFS